MELEIMNERAVKRGKKTVIGVIITAVMLVGSSESLFAARIKEKPPIPDFTRGDAKGDSHDWTLGPTGARGWFYGWNGQTAEARQILVTAVAAGSPADGVLKAGDVILGVNDKPFEGDARIRFANAITVAETEKAGGVLKLVRWRDGKSENVEVKLAVMGTYSDIAPYTCLKSEKIFDMGCKAIAKKGLNGVSIPNNLNALALLASGKKEYLPMLTEYAQKAAEYQTDSMATWFYGYADIFLAEYLMTTGDQSVMNGVKRMALEAARGQSIVGTWGHKFARPDGNLNGYGCMNQPALSLTISLVLAREAGVREPAVDKAIAKSADFLRWFVNKGAIPYGDHQPWPGHEDNGKCSSGAVLFDLLGDKDSALFYAKMSTAAYSERERGHTGNFFNILWAMPGVSRCGPVAAGAYFKEQAWYYDLARGWDGSFSYQGSPVGEEEHGKYASWDSTGAYLLAYALPRKSLIITGRKPCSVPALKREEADEVIAAGRDFFVAAGKNGQFYEGRSTEQLLAGLSSWSPTVRKRSAHTLGRREGDFVPALLKLLGGSDLNARYGACEALGCLGPRADAAAPQLRALLKDPDPWMQSLAAMALPNLGDEARKGSITDLLDMAVASNPADPRRMAQRAACVALFSKYPGSQGPVSILADSLEGVDRDKLYPVIKSVLQNEDSVARGSLSGIYGKLNNADVAVLLPDIIQATEKLAPSNEMFGDIIRLAGLDLLSRLHIREGMPLCVSVIELDRWGQGRRIPKCVECLCRYGVHAKEVLPRLKELVGKQWSNEDIAKAVVTIETSTNAPVLVSAGEFIDDVSTQHKDRE